MDDNSDEEADENKPEESNENEGSAEKTQDETRVNEEKKPLMTALAGKLEDANKGKPVYLATTKSGCEAGGSGGASRYAAFNCSAFLQKRNPFIHDPPQPEERRPRISNPRCPREYLINLREDLADFQENHGLPRTRDYSFLSLGLALAQETARALCSLFCMFVELFPILAIVSLILRFALDKFIEILETADPTEKVKKSVIFSVQMLMIVIPLWIFVGTIIIPLVALVFSIFRRIFRLKKGKPSKSAPVRIKPKEKSKKPVCFSPW